MLFRKENDKLYEIPQFDELLLNSDEYIYIEDEDLPEALYPLFKLDESNNIIPDNERILEKAKKLKYKEINDIRNNILNSYFTYIQPSTGNEYKIDAGKDSQVNIIGLFLIALKDNTFSTYFITYDNQEIFLTNEDILSLFTQGSQWKQKVIFKARKLKDQIQNATNVTEVLNIDWDNA